MIFLDFVTIYAAVYDAVVGTVYDVISFLDFATTWPLSSLTSV